MSQIPKLQQYVPAKTEPQYLEYSSALLKKISTPQLDNVVIPAKDLEVGNRY